jgi:hypothetical protein
VPKSPPRGVAIDDRPGKSQGVANNLQLLHSLLGGELFQPGPRVVSRVGPRLVHSKQQPKQDVPDLGELVPGFRVGRSVACRGGKRGQLLARLACRAAKLGERRSLDGIRWKSRLTFRPRYGPTIRPLGHLTNNRSHDNPSSPFS